MSKRSHKHGSVARWCIDCKDFFPVDEWLRDHDSPAAKCFGVTSADKRKTPRSTRTCRWCGRELIVYGHAAHEKACEKKAKARAKEQSKRTRSERAVAGRQIVPVRVPGLHRGPDGLPSSLTF